MPHFPARIGPLELVSFECEKKCSETPCEYLFLMPKGRKRTQHACPVPVKSLTITSFAGPSDSVQPVTLKGEKEGLNGTGRMANGEEKRNTAASH